MTTVLVTGASGFVGSHLLPELVGAGHRVVALVRSQRAGERVMRRISGCRCRERGASNRRRRPTHHAVRGARRCRRGGPPRRDPTRLERRPRAPGGQPRRDPQRDRRHGGVRRPAPRPSRGARRRGRENLHYARSKATRRAVGAGERARLDDPRAVAAVRPARRVLQHRRRSSSGCRPASCPSPATGQARFQPLASPTWRCASGSAWSGPRRSGTPSSWAGPGPGRTARSRRRSAVRPATAGCIVGMPVRLIRSWSRARPRPSASRSRSPRTSFASLRYDNVGPLDGVHAAFGFVPRRMEGELMYLRRRKAQQGPTPAP